MDDDPLLVLRRWEDSGGTWRVTVRTPTRMVVELLSCDAGEVMSRVDSVPPGEDLLAHIGDRATGPE